MNARLPSSERDPDNLIVAPVGRPTKLSQNESPLGPLPSVRTAIVESAAAANRYPDDDTTVLTARLAAWLGVGTDAVAVFPGAVSILQLVLRAVDPRRPEVVYAWRSFEAYPKLVAQAGLTDVLVPLREERHDLPAMARALTERTGLVFLCQPNNPTGTVVSHAEVVRFLRQVPQDCLVVLDEAYVEYVRAGDSADGLRLLADWPNLVLIRTFSKAYGLAGLRVGYLVGAPPVVAAVRAQSVPFSVNSLAQAAAVACLDAQDELRERVEQTVAERTRVTGVLRAQGYPVKSSEGNFVWLRLGGRTAEFVRTCADNEVTVRAFPASGVRVSIGSAAENDRFLAVASDWLAGQGRAPIPYVA